jgi:preprotein translocase subunit SecE
MRAVKEVAAGFPEDDENRGKAQQVLGYPARVRQFLHDVRMELRNVTWPSKADVRATTMVVLIATFFFGFYLGTALDIPLSHLMTWLLENAPKWLLP